MSNTQKQEAHIYTPTRRHAIAGIAIAFGGLTLASIGASAATEEEISHTAESIHQEPVFKASRKRIYEALMDASQFDKIIQLSGAMKSQPHATAPTEINNSVGGAFSLFGGYITGRHIELQPEERIVQAWRVGSWDPGIYSIAKFELVEQNSGGTSGTKIVFDHTGFPRTLAEHLASGWKMNYWTPLEKFLS